MNLHVSIVWGGQAKPPDQLRPVLDFADDWMAWGTGFYVIKTSESIYTWQGRFKAVIGDGDHFFISEIADVTQTGGWMTMAFWERLRKPDTPTLQDIYSTILPPPSR